MKYIVKSSDKGVKRSQEEIKKSREEIKKTILAKGLEYTESAVTIGGIDEDNRRIEEHCYVIEEITGDIILS